MKKTIEVLQDFRLAGGTMSAATVLHRLILATDTEDIEGFLKWCVSSERGDEVRKESSYLAAKLTIELSNLERKLREGL